MVFAEFNELAFNTGLILYFTHLPAGEIHTLTPVVDRDAIQRHRVRRRRDIEFIGIAFDTEEIPDHPLLEVLKVKNYFLYAVYHWHDLPPLKSFSTFTLSRDLYGNNVTGTRSGEFARANHAVSDSAE
jgi:hypothetical protein